MSVLTDIVDRQTSAAVVTTFSRSVERMAERMADELLRDPVIRAELRAAVLEAFRRTVEELQARRADGPTPQGQA